MGEIIYFKPKKDIKLDLGFDNILFEDTTNINDIYLDIWKLSHNDQKKLILYANQFYMKKKQDWQKLVGKLFTQKNQINLIY